MAKEPETAQPKSWKGTRVRLLVAHYDGYQRLAEGTECNWWEDSKPDPANAVPVGDARPTPLDAPAMTDGRPPADYVDPTSGEKPEISGPTLAA